MFPLFLDAGDAHSLSRSLFANKRGTTTPCARSRSSGVVRGRGFEPTKEKVRVLNCSRTHFIRPLREAILKILVLAVTRRIRVKIRAI